MQLILSAFAAGLVICLTYAGVRNGQGAAFFLISVCGCAASLAWQLGTLDTENPKDCWLKFKVRACNHAQKKCLLSVICQANHSMGLVVLVGLCVDLALSKFQ